MRRTLFPRSLLVAACLAVAAGLALAADTKAVVQVDASTIAPGRTVFETKTLKVNGEKKLTVGRQATHTWDEYRRLGSVQFEKVQVIRRVGAASDSRIEISGSLGTEVCWCYPAKLNKPKVPNPIVSAESLLQAMVEIEVAARLGEKPRRMSIPFRSIRRVEFVSARVPIDHIAFEWSAAARSADAWRAFLAEFPASPRVAAARDQAAKLLFAHAHDYHRSFAREHRLFDLREGRRLAHEAATFRDNTDAELAGFIRELAEAEAAIERDVAEMTTRVEAGQWQEALQVHTRVAPYARDLPQVDQLRERANAAGHAEHLASGDRLAQQGRWSESLRAYKAAAALVSSPQAAAGIRRAGIAEALENVDLHRRGQRFDTALASLEESVRTYGDAPELAALAPQIQRDWSQQLVASAKTMAPRAIATLDDLDRAVRALDAYERAARLDTGADVGAEIAVLRTDLAMCYLRTAREKRALSGGRGIAQAHAHYAQAARYDSGAADSEEAREAREAFENKSAIGVAVRFVDRSLGGACGHVSGDLESRIGQAVTEARLPNVNLVERDALQALEREQAITQAYSGTEVTLNLQGAGLLVFGDILLCDAKQRPPRQIQVPSRYVSGDRPNARYMQLQGQIAQMEASISQLQSRQWSMVCGNAWEPAGAQCHRERNALGVQIAVANIGLAGLQGQLSRTRAQDPVESAYRFTKTDLEVTAILRGGYRFVDSVSSIRREQHRLNEEDGRKDTEISNAMPGDLMGNRDKYANLPAPEELFDGLLVKAGKQVADKTVHFLRQFDDTYLEKARKTARERSIDDAVENYILFLATSSESRGAERQEAAEFLRRERHITFPAPR